ncbi:TMEM175 family protein [Lactiplantibacillus herbarum]|uniref:TMEM175 family protein n=1 Tax=Lactiplantibacillus herbarum TaxID=1670446 RepID=UPI00064F8F09|nr:TMEM175 family protein [Lactiplantibacillus herbarum]
MNKERMAAFTDAVLAIIMTILVLELEKPATMTLAGLWDLRANFFAYALSFFWLGLMWLTHHNNWEKITRVNNQAAIFTLLMLFFASLFPYTTGLVATNFDNSIAQSFYGIVVLAVSFSNMGLSRSINKANDNVQLGLLYTLPDWMVILDIAIKVIGLILAITVYPPAMMYSIFISMFVIGLGHL